MQAEKRLSGVACNLDINLLTACYPLLEESRVEAIEWSFDALYHTPGIPNWFEHLLEIYSDKKRLVGHGVFFSIFSGKWTEGHIQWLKQLENVCGKYQFDHITEHFGFMTGKDFHEGAPLNLPYTKTTLEIGIDRLKRIADTCRCPVGLENLAFSYSIEEVKRHGDFLEKLVGPVNGFIILDLHNLYCQLHNFDIDFESVIGLYPLHRVREIHISGGSWDESLVDKERKIRRDTHDDAVPDEVFHLLELVMRHCPNLKYVVMEQLGAGLQTEESRKLFYDDFLKMEEIVQLGNQKTLLAATNTFLPPFPLLYNGVIENEILHSQQRELSVILESAVSFADAVRLLENSSLAHSDWNIERWQPYMLETAIKIAQKWKDGFK